MPRAKRPSSASIDGDYSISDLNELVSSGNNSSNITPRSSSGDFQFDYNKEQDDIAKEDKSQTRYLKALVLLFLAGLAVTVALLVSRGVREDEDDKFQTRFHYGAEQILERWERNLGLQMRAMDSLSIHVTSWAEGSNSTWPQVTVPDFEVRGSSTRGFTDTLSVMLLPMVTDDARTAYERYTQQNLDWIPENEASEVSSTIVRQMNGTGPYFPVWTLSPIVSGVVNVDLGSDPIWVGGVQEAFLTQQIVFGEIFNTSATNGLYNWNGNGTTEEAIGSVHVPVLEDGRLVALLAASISWESILADDLSPIDEGYIAVVTNECGQQFSVQFHGTEVEYLGQGDQHDPDYSSYQTEYKFEELVASVQDFLTPGSSLTLNGDYCPYHLSVYPTQQLRDTFETKTALWYALSIAIVFILTAAVFGFYDNVMERRRRTMLQSAVEARAIVASLFPKQFRTQLFEQQRRVRKLFKRRQVRSTDSKGEKSKASSSDHPSEEFELPMEHIAERRGRATRRVSHSTLRIKSFLNDSNNMSVSDIEIGRPIADLFPNTTVLFGDLCGFTSWCSQRDPENVFALLEAIFKAFDKVARKRHVFKVETIGDCYMCVTGLPNAQHDHAWRMARFALEARTKMADVLRDLESILGPDTSELSMRFGMHSGPTTAGVLRGDKSRFQLFGDTVNTASRMESTGAPNRIQLSQATADRLTEFGKGSWLRQREDLVVAKGKGKVKTYWLASRPSDEGPVVSEELPSRRALQLSGLAAGTHGISTRMDLGADFSDSEEEADTNMMMMGNMSTLFEEAPPELKEEAKRKNKAVMWQAEQLIRALRLIVARRGQHRNEPIDVSGILFVPDEGDVILDEVVESIDLPDLDAHAMKSAIDPEDVALSPAVIAQAHDFVGMIASMYTEGLEFHNFEHATHMAMSASKLLSRIVVPDVEDINLAEDLHVSTDGINSDALTQFAILFAAMVHDVDHPGVPNSQLGKEDADLALLYKNKSIAEQKSFDLAWELLMDRKYLELRSCIYTTYEELVRFRQLVVNCIMATDLFDTEMNQMRDRRWEKEFGDVDYDSQDLVFGNRQATILIEHICQVSDVAHMMQHWHVFRKWDERLFRERMQAYRDGRAEEDPSRTWYEDQVEFFDNFVIPLAKRLEGFEVFGIASSEHLSYAQENREEWMDRGHDVVKEMLQAWNEGFAESWTTNVSEKFGGSGSIDFEILND